ncbi:MAG: hypothetical protein A2287_10785 [Candidatus Melainabacteria bacterium RIFOXYA12_FULL_32_12]|nr:MAG: hypothetical protein A2287_10785 [Candidatus Melainabacteria bacterium RIFOXYA12_FULL_32_12]
MQQEKIAFEAGDVIAFAEETIIGHFARLFTGWRINHVGILINSDTMIESVVIYGVRSVSFSEFIRRPGDKYLCKLTNDHRAKFKTQEFNKFVDESKNKKYDYFQATLLAINKFIYPITFKEDYSKLFCNELVAGALKAAGVLSEKVNVVALTPPEIFNLQIYSKKIKIG